MTNTTLAPVPPPGSDAAIEAGCTCFVVDRGDIEPALMWLSNGCPVHDPLPDLHLRPRQPGDADAE